MRSFYQNSQYGDLKDWIPSSVASLLPTSVAVATGVTPAGFQAPPVPTDTAQAYDAAAAIIEQSAASLPTFSARSEALQYVISLRATAGKQRAAYASAMSLGPALGFWFARWWSGFDTTADAVVNVLRDQAKWAVDHGLAQVAPSLMIYASRVAITMGDASGKSPFERTLDTITKFVTFGVFSSFRRAALFGAVMAALAIGLSAFVFRRPIGRIVRGLIA